ncbi:truncated polyprotein [Chaoyang virus]|uniref:truncated polyprotein n=2 Tax=Chaoyang virus TaxID=631267 RepID=UPI0008068035|nr:truncated polyprotein [Chaoyang virus]
MANKPKKPGRRAIDIVRRALPRVSGPKKVLKKATQTVMESLAGIRATVAYLLYMTFLGNKVSKATRAKFRSAKKSDLIKILSSFKRTVTNLLASVQKRKRKAKRSVTTPSMALILLTMSCMAYGATRFTRNGFVYMNVTGSDVGTWLSIKTAVGNGSCIVMATDVGTWCEDTVTYLCPKLDGAAEPDDIDCWCKVVSVYVTYGRCRRDGVSRRSRRSVALAPHGTGNLHTGEAPMWKSHTDASKYLQRVERWALRNPGYLGILVAIGWLLGRTTAQRVIYITLLVLIGPAYSLQCIDVAKRDFIQGVSGGTWVDVVLDVHGCVTIAAEGKPTVDFKLTKLEMTKLAKVRAYCLTASVSDITVESGCPGTGEIHNTKAKDTSYMCKVSYPDRGWGNGCGLFGKGSMETCAKFACTKQLHGHVISRENIEAEVDISIHGQSAPDSDDASKRKNRKELATATITPQASSIEADMGDFGKVGMDCSLDIGIDFEQVLIVDTASRWWMVKRDWFQDLALPWTSPSADFWHDRDRLVEFGVPHATRQSVYSIGDQEGAFFTAVAKAPSVEWNSDKVKLATGFLKCRIKLGNMKLKGSTYVTCAQAFTFAKRPVDTGHGTVVFQVSYAGTDAPCKIPVAVTDKPNGEHVGRLVTAHPFIAKQNEKAVVEVEPPFGDSYIEIGAGTTKISEAWHKPGSSIGNALALSYKGMKRITAMGEHAWDFGSIGGFFSSMGKAVHHVFGSLFRTLFGGIGWMAKILIGALLIWLGISTRDRMLATSFILTGSILLYLATTTVGVSEIGCSLDITHREIKCGDGIFIFRDAGGWRDKYVFHPGSPKTLAAAIWKGWNDGICGVRSATRMEHEMWKQIENELNGILEENDIKLSVVVKNANGTYPRGTKSLTRNTTGLQYGWKSWGKTMFVSVPIAENTFIIDGNDEGECASDKRAWNTFKIEEFGTGIMKTKVFLDLADAQTEYCDTELLGAAVKGNKSVHGDPGLWMTASKESGDWKLESLSMTESRRCLWPDSHTIWGRGVLESKLILPSMFGGPVSHMNTRPGYATQLSGPWNNVPLDVVFEECPGTKVVVENNCTNRGESIRSTTDSGKIIPEWCCRKCTMPPLTYRTPDGCWYAMEIRPKKASEESLLRSKVSAGTFQGIDDFSLGLLVLIIFVQEGLKRRMTSRYIMLAALGLLLAAVLGDLTYNDIARYVIMVGVAFAEMNNGGDLIHLALIATFKVQPGYLLFFLLRKQWSPRESTILASAAVVLQICAAAWQSTKSMQVLNALAMGWLYIRAIVVPGALSKAMPLICMCVPGVLSLTPHAIRVSMVTIAAGTLIKGTKGTSVRKHMPYFLGLVGAVAGLDPLGMLGYSLLTYSSGKRSWPAGEIMTAVGLTCAMIGALSGNAMNDIAGPAAAASLIFVAYAISGRSADVFLEKAGEISWIDDAAVSGSSPRVDVQVTDGGDFSASPRSRGFVAKEWSDGFLSRSGWSTPVSDSGSGVDLVRFRKKWEAWHGSLGYTTSDCIICPKCGGRMLQSDVKKAHWFYASRSGSDERLSVSHNVARHPWRLSNEW